MNKIINSKAFKIITKTIKTIVKITAAAIDKSFFIRLKLLIQVSHIVHSAKSSTDDVLRTMFALVH